MEETVCCIRCEVPLECPAWRQVQAPTIAMEFAVCEDCREHYLNEENPALFFELSGQNFKNLLKHKNGTLAIAKGD